MSEGRPVPRPTPPEKINKQYEEIIDRLNKKQDDIFDKHIGILQKSYQQCAAALKMVTIICLLQSLFIMYLLLN